MKTNKTFRTALVAAMVSVASLASAQSYTLASGTDATDNVDSAHVDYVTVTSTMPYETTQGDISAWLSDLSAAGFGSAPSVTNTTQWLIDNVDIPSATTSKIYLKWNQEGTYKLTVKNSLSVDGKASCDPAVSGKTVYVLPKPNVKITTANQMLACTATTFDVKYKVTGIGEKQIAYSVTRKPFGEAEVNSADEEAVGSGALAAAFNGDESFSDAKAKYENIDSKSEETFTVDNLAPGYIYTLTFTEVSDQISRKSKVDNIAPVSNAKVVLAVVPSPASTKINHVKNIE